MKTLKIWMIALSIGVVATACKNNTDCKTSASDSTAMPQTTTTANAPMAPVTDTQSSASMNDNNNATGNETGTNTGNSHMHHRGGKRDTLAKGPDLKASKKREGNFTSGTGADNIGK